MKLMPSFSEVSTSRATAGISTSLDLPQGQVPRARVDTLLSGSSQYALWQRRLALLRLSGSANQQGSGTRGTGSLEKRAA